MSTDPKKILRESECLFTWKLRGEYKRDSLIAKFKSIVNRERYVGPNVKSWYARACLAHQLFLNQNVEAFEEVNQAIEELEETDDRLSKKCMKACQHTLYAQKAFMISKCEEDGGWWGVDDLPSLQEAVNIIPQKGKMTREEQAGLYGFKTEMMALHCVFGEAASGIHSIRAALQLDPSEYEWKISLATHLIRSNLYIRGEKYLKRDPNYIVPWSAVSEPLRILEELLKDATLPYERKIAVLYFQAVAEEHFNRNRAKTPRIIANIKKIDALWRKVLESQTMNPVHIKYGAMWFLENSEGGPTSDEYNLNLILEAVLKVVQKYPTDRGSKDAVRIVRNLPEHILTSSETARRITEFRVDKQKKT